MHLFNELAETKIMKAIHTGDLEQLSGMGEPVDVDIDPLIPELKKMAYKILKNADNIPQELQIRNQIHEIEKTLASTELQNRKELMLRLQVLFIRLDITGYRYTNLLIQNEYYEEMLLRLAQGTDKPS